MGRGLPVCLLLADGGQGEELKRSPSNLPGGRAARLTRRRFTGPVLGSWPISGSRLNVVFSVRRIPDSCDDSSSPSAQCSAASARCGVGLLAGLGWPVSVVGVYEVTQLTQLGCLSGQRRALSTQQACLLA
jgi:hypothetical protein